MNVIIICVLGFSGCVIKICEVEMESAWLMKEWERVLWKQW